MSKKKTSAKAPAVEKASVKTAEIFKATAEFSTGNVDAYAKSAKVASEGLKTIRREISLYAKKSAEESLAAMKEIMASKSLPEAMARQSSFAKMALGAYMGQLKLLNELYVAALKDTLAPVQARAEEITKTTGAWTSK